MGAVPGAAVDFRFRPLRWADVRAAARWRYPPPYARYNLRLVPLAAIWLAQQPLALAGVAVYYAVTDGEGDELAGLFSFLRTGDTVEIGVAMRPELTGRGQGLAFVQAGLAFGRAEFRPARFRLTVAPFNRRAIAVYERAGFRHVPAVKRPRPGRDPELLEMVREA